MVSHLDMALSLCIYLLVLTLCFPPVTSILSHVVMISEEINAPLHTVAPTPDVCVLLETSRNSLIPVIS